MLGLGLWQSIYFIFYVVFVDCIFAGIVVATFLWLVTNRYLRTNQLEPDIEWGYAFDVHLNAFFPPLMLLHFVQLLFYNWLISQSWFISRFIGNTFWLLALGYYVYITFLGYNCKFSNNFGSPVDNALVIILFIMHRCTSSKEYAAYPHSAANHLPNVYHHFNHKLECVELTDGFLQISCLLDDSIIFRIY